MTYILTKPEGINPKKKRKIFALAGNRTRAARVAGEPSTTEPPTHVWRNKQLTK